MPAASFSTTPRRRSALRALLLSGAGISVTDDVSVQADLAAGRLVQLLPDWRMPSGGIHAVFPPGRHLAAAARAFVDFYRERIGQRAEPSRRAGSL
jgi:DNA-binding transcriptional LysR family regulator